TKPGKCVEGILEIFDMLLAMTSRFRELKLQHKEYLCVKAMILLNSSEYTIASDTHQIVLISTEAGKLVKLHHLLNVVTDALVWVIAKSGIPSQQQTTRLANLLMLLSHVRHLMHSVDFGGTRYGLNSVLVAGQIFCVSWEPQPLLLLGSLAFCHTLQRCHTLAFLMGSSSSAPCQLPVHLRFLVSACSTVVSNAGRCK
uniref:Estrogen receptor 2 n=1 Tax=Pavo cristatus TaxID=9049 RepID=A0A8C9G2E0_PAVCR